MLSLAWHWVTSWIIGWGGLGALVSAIAWALWFFCPTVPLLEKVLPYKAQLLHVAIGATIFTVCSTYFFTHGYNKGYAVAINAVAARDQAAIARVKQGEGDLMTCRAGGGTWDVTTGTCGGSQ